MKKQIEAKKQTPNKTRRMWKIVSISLVVIFLIFIVGGAIKASYFRSSLITPTQAQIDFAKKKAAEKLQATGANMTAFQSHAAEKMRRMREDGISRDVIQVSFYSESAMHIYIVDVNSGEVLLHSETETYGTWKSNKTMNHKGYAYPDMEHRR